MQYFTSGQANTVYMDVIAKASGSAIASGTVNFYLIATDGDNAGKWFRASDSSWQSSETPAGEATYKGGAAWSLSIAAAAWDSAVNYILYAKESGDLNIVYNEHISDKAVLLSLTGITAGGTWSLSKILKILLAWSAGNWQLKSGESDVYEVLDPEDGETVIAEVTPKMDESPFKQVTIL